ncbi:MAG: hypothetical protein PW788_12150 [Micavibrio sp.]|nr:hypothetical protein [Micavibrio sp.]
MTIFLAKNQRCDMAYNGPMRSGLIIDTRALVAQGYAEYQHNLAEKMGAEWYAPGYAVRGNHMQIDVDTRRGRTIIPGYFIGRQLAGDFLTATLKRLSLKGEVTVAGDCAFTISSIDVRLYDMGYGSATFKGEITALRDLTLDEYRTAAENAGSALADWRSLYMETFEQVHAALKPDYVVASFLGSKPHTGYWSNSCLAHGLGDLFWVHRLFTVACDTEADFGMLRDRARYLVYSEQAELLEDSAIATGVALFPGNGNSVAVYDKSRAKVSDTNTLPSMVRAQNIFYVSAEDIDRDLFHLSNDLDRHKHSSDMSLLERQSRVIVEYQSKVTLFKSVYDDFDNSLDPQGLKVWHALEKAWHTRDRFNNLNTKLDLVEKIYNRIRDNLNHLQNKRLGVFMLAFTLISTLSVIVDTVDFTQGGALQAPSALRVGVLIILLSGLAFFALRLLDHRKEKL